MLNKVTAITGRTRRRSRPMTGPHRRLRTINITGSGAPKTAGERYGGAQLGKRNGHRPLTTGREITPLPSNAAGKSVDVAGGMGA